jgi:hypothetical protein
MIQNKRLKKKMSRLICNMINSNQLLKLDLKVKEVLRKTNRKKRMGLRWKNRLVAVKADVKYFD